MTTTTLINLRVQDVTAENVLPRKAYFVADYAEMVATGDRKIGSDEAIHSYSDINEYTNLTLAINTMLINTAYNYSLNIGDSFLFMVDLPGDDNATEFMLEVDSKGLFVKDILTCAEAEECTDHVFTFDHFNGSRVGM